jgi:DNA polymerase I-like protein with 3'-5' exonuclease and polymerase domains
MHKALPYRDAITEHGDTTRLRRAYTYKALNRLIQASAADMTKQAMVNIYETGKTPLIQIHDEIAISVKNIDEAKKYSTIMETAVPLIIPNKCDIEIGNSWGEAE